MFFPLVFATESAQGFGINSNILETNLVNLLIVLAILIYFGKGFLGKILANRLQQIESAIKEAEARQEAALKQLNAQQERLAQAQAEANRILQQAELDAQAARSAILAGVEADIAKLRTAAEQEIASEQARVVAQLRRQVAEQALREVQAQLDRGLSASVQDELVQRSLSLLSP
jgi:F-type H+-transporting ATPase subunit b